MESGSSFDLVFTFFTDADQVTTHLAIRTVPKAIIVKNTFFTPDKVQEVNVDGKEQIHILSRLEAYNPNDFSIKSQIPYQISGYIFRQIGERFGQQSSRCGIDVSTHDYRALIPDQVLIVPSSLIANDLKSISRMTNEPSFGVTFEPKSTSTFYIISYGNKSWNALLKQGECWGEDQNLVQGCHRTSCKRSHEVQKCRWSRNDDNPRCSIDHVECDEWNEEANSPEVFRNSIAVNAVGIDLGMALQEVSTQYADTSDAQAWQSGGFSSFDSSFSFQGSANFELPIKPTPKQCSF